MEPKKEDVKNDASVQRTSGFPDTEIWFAALLADTWTPLRMLRSGSGALGCCTGEDYTAVTDFRKVESVQIGERRDTHTLAHHPRLSLLQVSRKCDCIIVCPT